MKPRRFFTMLFGSTVMLILACTAFGFENIDPDDEDAQYAWAENVGWLNLEPSQGPGVTVADLAVTGYIWAENIGWINLSPASYGGVANDGSGNLSGYAWGENVGWINFNPTYGGVTIDPEGTIDGWAWGENIGWIRLQYSMNLSIEKTGVDDISLSWDSSPGANYSVRYSDDPYSGSMTWNVLQSGIPSGGTSTTWVDVNAPTTGERYYEVEDEGSGVMSYDRVGVVWESVGQGRNLVSTPLIPDDTSLDTVIDGQLTGSAFNKFFSDNIEAWDNATSNYLRAWHDTSNWLDWDTGGAPQFGWYPDAGYWINILVFNPAQDISFVGRVADTQRLMGISVGRNLSGTSYPMAVSLDDSELIDSGFTGNVVNFWSDNVEWWNRGTLNYDRVWYDTGVGQWKNWDGTPTAEDFSPFEGFWVNVLMFNPPFTWAYPRPYSQPAGYRGYRVKTFWRP